MVTVESGRVWCVGSEAGSCRPLPFPSIATLVPRFSRAFGRYAT